VNKASTWPKNHSKEETGVVGYVWLARRSTTKRNAFFIQKGVKMRNFIGLLVLAAALATSSVQAAENNFSWTGFYIGAHGGYGWSNDRHVETSSPPAPAPLFSAIKSSGYIVGGHAGFNWQQGMFVGGVEVDATLPKLSGITTIQFTQPPFIDSFGWRSLSVDYFGTVRGRVGIVPHQSVLLYATGGLAWAKTTEEVFSTSSLPTSSSSGFSSTPATLFGFVVGAGAEASLGSVGLSNVLLRLEYLHYDYGKQASGASTSSVIGFPANSLSVSNGPITVDTLRAGLSMKFWPGS
jgi:opacity protein-like surface antigen